MCLDSVAAHTAEIEDTLAVFGLDTDLITELTDSSPRVRPHAKRPNLPDAQLQYQRTIYDA